MRLLVIQSPSALEPVRFRGKILWRMNDRCVEVDAAGWHATQMARRGYDWSAEESTIAPSAVRPGALDVARTFLRQSGEQHAINLANSQDPELLRRLNVVTHDELLTNAGVLAFVGRGNSAIDYIRRDLPGGDSIQRLRPEGASLLEEVAHVDQAMRAHVRRQHLGGDLVRGQVEELPLDVIREAVVNGIVHRDWAAPAPTVVEHTGSTLTVVSPGGFVGGITPSNIITHPSTPRYQSLAELFAALRIAEREGIGVDRMVGGMLRLGHHAPVIEEKQGPTVRTALVGGVVDEAWLNWLRRMEPEPSQDLQVLMLIRHLVDHGWVDVDAAHRLLQVTPVEAHAALLRAETVELDNSIPCVVPIKGTPSESQPGFTLSKEARKILDASERRQGWRATAPTLTPRAVALDWARHRGRVSSTELASIMGASHTNMSRYLRELEDEGLLEPSRPSRAGRGFYYRWSGDSDTE